MLKEKRLARITAHARDRQLREEIADFIEDLDVGRRRRARSLADGRLIDFVNRLDRIGAANLLQQRICGRPFVSRRSERSPLPPAARLDRISVDLPEPEMPVITESRPIGKRTSTFFKLFARAPRISIQCSTSPNERRDLRSRMTERAPQTAAGLRIRVAARSRAAFPAPPLRRRARPRRARDR